MAASQLDPEPPALPERDRGAPRAQKPMPWWRTALFPRFAWFLAQVLRLYWATLRVRVHGEEHLEPLLERGERFIPCVWHQRQIMGVAYLRRLRRRGVVPGALVSPSKDGELGARLLAKLGVTAVRGSGRRSGALAMRDMYLAIKEANLSPLIAPDGSTGPPHEFKPGAIMLARLSGSPVVPISFACSSGVKLRTWDRLLVPFPFSRVVVEVGEPIELDPIMAMTESPETVDRMGAALTAVEAAAEARLGRVASSAD
ncbi:MAG: lysophospholipid acyltransferase family protein [Planctomycetota bacterium]|nr:lysophospholipid acyltransferase family protein [Planctomycetota bacterium]MDG1985514.1 lysophospholipid acyltransferase family protein [Planctomycetota bacterium]